MLTLPFSDDGKELTQKIIQHRLGQGILNDDEICSSRLARIIDDFQNQPAYHSALEQVQRDFWQYADEGVIFSHVEKLTIRSHHRIDGGPMREALIQ